MKLYKLWNTSSDWWVIAPNEEIALDYSYKNTLTKEKRNLGVSSDTYFSSDKTHGGLNELLKGNRIGIVIRVRTDEPPFEDKWIFTISHEWIPEQLTWRR
ncbi:hypothetical protein [Nostoc sp. TCL240-02]|uniref:hypothetical protein n=1 Tax=Nostoc sp. TCL240-02 TaxID=2572090 RepID=UPI00157FBC87|nr:hypothetical protein [Nostoc sp. TCL240-02]QKQ74403.1 hypothetical protein FBB35_14665 [Nostoc sp. TCL240-02]